MYLHCTDSEVHWGIVIVILGYINKIYLTWLVEILQAIFCNPADKPAHQPSSQKWKYNLLSGGNWSADYFHD